MVHFRRVLYNYLFAALTKNVVIHSRYLNKKTHRELLTLDAEKSIKGVVKIKKIFSCPLFVLPLYAPVPVFTVSFKAKKLVQEKYCTLPQLCRLVAAETA